ncbi:hypothetical protein CYMTET_52952 [Cymbomonas tetramitiformis]|uniref:J domain-containing protein n=1 Tax=Cymbomonas tetramitiformis TaxID=36881 RepID=A0AAE0BHY0_9CHLO|nr:hypothetical protein CYMTET_52952 [Cymbomonas tetramitiformis]
MAAGSLTREKALATLELSSEDGQALEQLRAQYKSLALKLHPDKNKAPQATERFKRVTLAYHYLISKEIPEQNWVEDQFEAYEADLEVLPLEKILEMALTGTDIAYVERLLKFGGSHRPPENFGVAPYPSFNAGTSLERRGTKDINARLLEDERTQAANAAAERELEDDVQQQRLRLDAEAEILRAKQTAQIQHEARSELEETKLETLCARPLPSVVSLEGILKELTRLLSYTAVQPDYAVEHCECRPADEDLEDDGTVWQICPHVKGRRERALQAGSHLKATRIAEPSKFWLPSTLVLPGKQLAFEVQQRDQFFKAQRANMCTQARPGVAP